MAIGFRAKADAINTTTCSKPTGTASGDVLLAHIFVDSQSADATGPSGWTRNLRQSNGTGTTDAECWRRVCDGSEGSSFTWTNLTGYVDITIECYTGVDTTTPMDATSVGLNAGSGTTSPTTPTITTVTNDAWIVGFLTFNGSATITKPSSMTERANFDSSMGVADEDIPTAGSTGARTWTLSVAQVTTSITSALRPASGAAAVTPPRPTIVRQAVQRAATR